MLRNIFRILVLMVLFAMLGTLGYIKETLVEILNVVEVLTKLGG